MLIKSNVPKALIANSIRRQSLTQNRLSRIDQPSRRNVKEAYAVPKNQPELNAWLEK